MNSFSLSLSLSFSSFIFFVFVQNFSTQATPHYLYHFCPHIYNFTRNSTYQSNLNTLLSSLSSAATNGTNGFVNATAGQNHPDRAYGLFLCRGDVSTSTCSNCVATGKQDILRKCQNKRASTIWYDECMLRYDNRSFFSAMETVPTVKMANTTNITNPTQFSQVLGQTVDDVATRASNSGKKFAVKEVNFTSLQTLYTLAQCTSDLTTLDCNWCLRVMISGLPQEKQGGRRFSMNCGIRFELYRFYNASAVVASAPPASQLPPPPVPVTRRKGKSNKTSVIIVTIAIPVGVGMVLLFLACFIRRRKATKTFEVVQGYQSGIITNTEFLQYDLATIQAATENFSRQNKLGEGGFSEVFQGRFPNGQQIAVKRLSQGLGQGAKEFKNEVILVAKLQHRNLVRLLGFCLEGEEKLLVYEFVPNKSLDYILFDPEKSRQLDWSRRYKIVYGIARGMLYLHEESQLRIIHRDLKVSNILLDNEMNPKISDFGMARIFGVDQTKANTNKIVGTFGYMAPEYGMHGQFSVKSDVFSFGVLLLELISGKKNSFFYQADGGEGLASYAWRNWRDSTPLKVLDPAIGDSYSWNEVLRCLHIGLLCVQEDPMDRPTMANIVLTLNSYSVTLALPQQPAFFLRSRMERQMRELEPDQSTSRSLPLSTNEMSVTEIYPR